MNLINACRLRLIDIVAGLKISKVLEEFKMHQYLPIKELNKIRAQRLNQLFKIAQESTAYYASFHNLKELPVLNKKMILQRPSDFKSNSYKGKIFKKSTSGTTGIPFFYETSVKAQSSLWAGLLLSWECTGYQFGDKVAFVGGSAVMKNSFKHKVFYQLMNIETYPVVILTNEIIKQYLGNIISSKAKIIYGYSTAINILADYINKEKIEFTSSLKSIVCTAEMLTPNMRENIEKAFGVKVFNQYGCNEAGISSFECEHRQLHLISSRSMYEVNDDGTLLSTDLSNEASFYLKYNTGDIVEFSGKQCDCGRSYPVIKNIIGRSDDVIVDRQNKKIHGSYFSFLFKKDKSVKQYQVLFDDKSLNMNLMVDKNFSEKNYNYYLDHIRNDFDFEAYNIKMDGEFYTNRNLKHTFIVDKRKYKQQL